MSGNLSVQLARTGQCAHRGAIWYMGSHLGCETVVSVKRGFEQLARARDADGGASYRNGDFAGSSMQEQ